jgi:putative tryptophan/tyrosine transport system substrate-binding protein
MKSGRRGFLRLAGSAFIVSAIPARSQQGSNLPIVAVLLPMSIARAQQRVDTLRTGLREAGMIEGVHYVIALRTAEGQIDRLPALAKELQSLNPAVFVSGGTLQSVSQLRPTPPVVFTAIAIDPVARGLAKSYAQPGGMFTGNVLNALGGEDTIAERRITLFKELVPSLTHLGVFGPTPAEGVVETLFPKEVDAAERAALRLGFAVSTYPLKSIGEFEPAMKSALSDGVDGFYLSGEPLLISNLHRVSPLIMAARKPAVGSYVEMARAGVLMTYGADLNDGFRRAASHVARIIRGAKPGDLPIEQPTKFTLAINATTAKQLAIAIPPVVHALVDELVE